MDEEHVQAFYTEHNVREELLKMQKQWMRKNSPWKEA